MTAAQQLALELGPHGIRVNCVAPGHIDGTSLRLYFAWIAERRGVGPDDVHAEIAGLTALNHIPTSEEISRAVGFFASPLSAGRHRPQGGRDRARGRRGCGEAEPLRGRRGAAAGAGRGVSGRLERKRAIVSGAGPGLGREVAPAFAREGAAAAVAARTESTLDAVVADIEAKGGRAVAVPTDITDVDQCRRLVERTVAELGGVDVLVNNAFVPGRFTLFEDADLDDWRATFEVNLFGPLQLSQQVVPTLKAAGGGPIVFVDSMVIRKLLPAQGGCASSKGGLLTAAQVLAKELGQHRIRVNSVHPGWALGPNVEAMFAYVERKQGRSRQEQYDEIAANVPLGTIPTAAGIAEAVVFFASDRSAVVTGQSLDVNGGEFFH